MKVNPMNKANWKFVVLLTLFVLTAGGLATWFVNFGQINFLANPWSLFDFIRPYVSLASFLCLLLTSFLLVNARRNNQNYLLDESDERIILFQKANRQYQQAMFFNAVAQINLIFNIIAGFRLLIEKSGALLTIPILDLLLFGLAGLQQGYANLVYREIRQTDFPLFPKTSQVKNNIYQFDEGELQSHHFEAYQTLLNMTYYILPGLFVALAIVSYLTGQVQIIALIMLLVIYLYTSWSLYWVAGRYYR